MYKLRLIKGISYTGYGVRATFAKPFVTVEKKDVSDALVASGYFSFVGEEASTNIDKNQIEKSLEKMTEKELEAYATQNGIGLDGLSKKADKLAKIQQDVASDTKEVDLFTEED